MATDGKLMDMLTEYAASHRHPFNIFMHIIGIPTIMLGILIPLTWTGFEIADIRISFAHFLILGFFLFYLSLDTLFASAFLLIAFLLLLLAERLGNYSDNISWYIAIICLIGGYIGQFIGHAVEKSKPVLIKHPIQAHLAAPFFIVVELFKLAGLREEIFSEIQSRINS
ncbi:MAG: DUF962 domain-containing protein [Woeseiaceae bacterium]|nr:DUF962 domain-containing protein [Woeseiaceae bacterium]